jgi:acyl-CoA oxidase
VFANLITKSENHGLHAFIVPVRDSQGKVLPGVKLDDLGNKMYAVLAHHIDLANTI